MKRVFTKKFLNYDGMISVFMQNAPVETHGRASRYRHEYQKRRTAAHLYRTSVTKPLSSYGFPRGSR